MVETGELVFISVQIPKEMDQSLRAIAAALRTSRSEIVRIAIEEYIEKATTSQEKYQVVSIHTLPHPPDADPVPVVYVK